MTPTTKLLDLARKAIEASAAADLLPGHSEDVPALEAAYAAEKAFEFAAHPSAIIALVERCERAEEQRDALLGAGKRGLACLIGAGCEHSDPARRLRAAIALCEPTETQVTR